jgi:hypothetical protein
MGGQGIRTRWAAIGAAIAVTLGGGAFGVVRATVSSGERASYFPITPTRVLDTRDTTEVTNGTLRLTVEGQIAVVGESSARTVVPTDATAVAVNLTVTLGRKNGNYGYVTAYPCTSTADPAPNASSLNFENGVDIANALNVTTSSNGSICLYVYGTADLIVDIAGYYADHDHDDRYYTKAQTDTQTANINLALDGKADTTDLHQPVIPTSPRTLDSTGDVGWHTSIAIGIDGNPIISYHDNTNGDLKVAVCTNPTCTNSTTSTLDSTGIVGWFTSIAIGADGNPIISYHDDTNGDLKVAACTNPTCTTATTSTLDTTGNVGYYTSIAIGLDGNPIISYADNGDLKVAACTNPTCTTATTSPIDTTGNVGWFTSIAIGIDGNPIISYYDDTNEDLKVAACTNPTCTTSTTSTTTSPIDTTGNVGWFTSIAIGIDGNPIISYYDDTNGDLKVAVCTNPTCTTATTAAIDTALNVGAYTSIAIGADGNPIISYYDGTNFDLKVAACTDPTCITAAITTSSIDTTGDVGAFTSIAIGANGNPIISYYDGTNSDLKVAFAWWLAGGR